MRAPGVGHRVPREARSVAKERQRGAKGCQRRTKRGPGWAKGCQDCRSRAPKWCQNGSKMNLAMVQVPILKMSKNHRFFHSKWPRSQSRTSQNAPRGPNGRPLGRAFGRQNAIQLSSAHGTFNLTGCPSVKIARPSQKICNGCFWNARKRRLVKCSFWRR